VVPPDVPDNLKVPAGEKVFIHARAKGVQIYSCAAGTDGKFAVDAEGTEGGVVDEQGNRLGSILPGRPGS